MVEILVKVWYSKIVDYSPDLWHNSLPSILDSFSRVNCCKLWFPNNLSVATFTKQVRIPMTDPCDWNIYLHPWKVKNGLPWTRNNWLGKYTHKLPWIPSMGFSWFHNAIFGDFFAPTIKYPRNIYGVSFGISPDFRGPTVGRIRGTSLP